MPHARNNPLPRRTPPPRPLAQPSTLHSVSLRTHTRGRFSPIIARPRALRHRARYCTRRRKARARVFASLCSLSVPSCPLLPRCRPATITDLSTHTHLPLNTHTSCLHAHQTRVVHRCLWRTTALAAPPLVCAAHYCCIVRPSPTPASSLSSTSAPVPYSPPATQGHTRLAVVAADALRARSTSALLPRLAPQSAPSPPQWTLSPHLAPVCFCSTRSDKTAAHPAHTHTHREDPVAVRCISTLCGSPRLALHVSAHTCLLEQSRSSFAPHCSSLGLGR